MEEVKIKKIDVENLKAVSSFTAVFDGKSAHVTGANGFGKSTVIRALTDRLRGLKPSIITKIGEKEGRTVMELTDGCRFEWEYNDQGKDSLNYFTPDKVKPVRRDVFKHICGQYFPNQFDINKFLTTTEPRKRLQMISELVNVDLTAIQLKYKDAFEIRKDAKRELKILESQIKPKPEVQTFDDSGFEAEQENVEKITAHIKVKKNDIEIERDNLNKKYLENKTANELKERKHQEIYQTDLDEWLESEEKRESGINDFNHEQEQKKDTIEKNSELLNYIGDYINNTFLEQFLNLDAANNFIDNMPQPKELKIFTASVKPEFKSLDLPDPMPSSDNLDEMKVSLFNLETDYSESIHNLGIKKAELSDLSASKQVYDLQLKQYHDYQKEVGKQANLVQDYENDVHIILEEIKAIVSETKLPDEFEIDLTNKNDILFRVSKGAEYLPITNETLASSAIYIAAFKLEATYRKIFRMVHFDISYLDAINRINVLKEAISMGIQLVTESPSLNVKSMELQYKITEE